MKLCTIVSSGTFQKSSKFVTCSKKDWRIVSGVLQWADYDLRLMSKDSGDNSCCWSQNTSTLSLPSTPPLLLHLAYLRYLKHFDWTSVAELVLSQIAEQHRVESYSVRTPPSPAAGATFKWTWLPLPRARHLRFLSLRSLWPAPSKQRGRESRRCGTADVCCRWKAPPVQPSK